jgi:hypothetical protein
VTTTTTTKPCGCAPQGLTRAFALWACAGCGHVQRAPRKRGAACAGCGRKQPPHPRGEGCHGHDVPVGARCPACARVAGDAGRLPHPEVEYLTESCERGNFRARDGFVRCVGCLALVG